MNAGLLAGGLFWAIGIAAQAQRPAQILELQNTAGLRIAVDTADSGPALILYVPDGPESERTSKILMPEHVTVRAHGQSEQTHLYVFRPGLHGEPANWVKLGNGLQYAHDFGPVRFTARATLTDDGIVFRYSFANSSPADFDMATAVTDPRFQGVFHDPRLERTYVHHAGGFELLASETPERLTMPLTRWFPVRYHASFTAPVPIERVQHRDDGIAYYYKSRPVDVPMIATLSTDGQWVAASFARDPGNVWTNPELTCQHVDPERPLAHDSTTTFEVKILVFRGTLEDAVRKVRAQRQTLQ
jgi:hypothetical protein